jgi:transposase-like protein
MAIHDEIMPKMGRLNELQQKMIDMAKASKDKNQKSSYQAMATELGRVSDSMFEWMEKFPENLDSLPEPQMKMILEEQKASISVMKEQMLNTLKKSDDIITNTKETNL